MTHRKRYRNDWHDRRSQPVLETQRHEGMWHVVTTGTSRLLAKLSDIALPVAGSGPASFGDEFPRASVSPGLGSLINGLNWDGMRDEVDQESRSRIVIAGAPLSGKSTLLNALKGAPVSPVAECDAQEASDASHGAGNGVKVEDFGLFSLLTITPDMSGDQAPLDAFVPNQPWQIVSGADLVVWLLNARDGLSPWEHEWICRIRAAGKPILVALNARKGASGQARARVERLEQALGCAIVTLCAQEGANAMGALLPRVVQACDKLNTALGREVPAWRPRAAQHVIGRSAVLSGLVGAEPVPLLDIPFQVMIQMRAMLRLAAIYGEPHGDRYSRELLATLVGGAGLRIASQQLTKAIPVLGWVCSGVFAAAGTWLMGQAAQQYFAMGRSMPIPRLSIRFELRRAATDNPKEEEQ